MKIQSKMKSLLSGQHFTKSIGPSRAGNSYANYRNWIKMELIKDFMYVLVICKADEDPIRNDVSINQTIFSPLYVYSSLKGQVTLMQIV